MNLIEMLRDQLDDDVVTNLRDEIGAESNEQTEAAANAVFSTLVAGLNKNAAQPEGANALVSALDRDHDGGILEDLLGNILGRNKNANPRTTNGAGILEHIFGNRQPQVNEGLGKATGLNTGQIMKLMISLAPMVLGMLGKARNKKGFGVADISDLLRGTVQTQTAQGREMGLLNRLLDSDGDGSIMDDIANLGRNAFLSRVK